MAKQKLTSPEAFLQRSERVAEAADVLKAMASDTRLKILCALNETEMSVTQLAELTGQSSSAVSQHLSKLRAAGLVASRRDAQTIYYRCSGGVGSALVNTLCDFYR
jgi:DNA-binding transcriptional ArsR family regulator